MQGPLPTKSPNDTHIAIVGAGIVGMSCALWLRKKGFKVTVLDGNSPGTITSYGNACIIADYACVPVNAPNLISRLPSLLFSANRPLSIDPFHAITHLPWLMAFLRHCKAPEVERITNTLGKLLLETNSGLDPLIEMTSSQDLFKKEGCMYVYQSSVSYKKAKASNQSRADNHVQFTQLDSNDIMDLEPNIKPGFDKGLLFNNARQVLNPKHLVDRYFQTFVENQGHYLHQHVLNVEHQRTSGGNLSLALANGTRFAADKAVICCGAFSKTIQGIGANKLPLDTERGYHVQFKNQQSLLNRPVGWAEAGLYATPTNEGLRFAGTVEIAGLSKPANPRNIAYLNNKAHQMFALDESYSSDWLGYRPTFPDSLPVIDYSPNSHDILFAFGHQHIGLTLAGITGKIIAELILGNKPEVDISGFSARRFE
ncbi:MAG: FAD-dependent oxidoreductase [Gammaproteobacteria bacterium]|nr:FAD-dependent oxidoreductase [Gammaproteobacteria bacterium]